MKPNYLISLADQVYSPDVDVMVDSLQRLIDKPWGHQQWRLFAIFMQNLHQFAKHPSIFYHEPGDPCSTREHAVRIISYFEL